MQRIIANRYARMAVYPCAVNFNVTLHKFIFRHTIGAGHDQTWQVYDLQFSLNKYCNEKCFLKISRESSSMVIYSGALLL